MTPTRITAIPVVGVVLLSAARKLRASTFGSGGTVSHLSFLEPGRCLP